MLFARVTCVGVVLTILTILSAGCRTPNVGHVSNLAGQRSMASQRSAEKKDGQVEIPSRITPASFEETSDQSLANDRDDPFAGLDETKVHVVM